MRCLDNPDGTIKQKIGDVFFVATDQRSGFVLPGALAGGGGIFSDAEKSLYTGSYAGLFGLLGVLFARLLRTTAMVVGDGVCVDHYSVFRLLATGIRYG